ncbi:hypothetical protein QYE76_036783 [Lolium multiflorum]|uniref:DUF4220 domain-containing protein n=1 Tax=Lolium multiflorum TaxID=4521 RepID=A0AAD8R1I2_LOLMU|nr:hypothetical protein QYE76_036783 [Lolium multiflorum]
MAAGLLEPLVVFWKEWGVLALVMLSFTLQVILLITAEIRRRNDSGALKVVVWLAYLLADTTAIYTLGHMSITSPTSQDQKLMAFWAPFLLLHLGGQDNITAYSIEDNRLWLRHLQSFIIQVIAAGYVLYQSSIVARRTLFRPAAILMFVVGVVKYGERVCALQLACTNNMSRKNYPPVSWTGTDDDESPSSMGPYPETFRAHVLLDFPKQLLKGPLPIPPECLESCEWEEMYGVAEMQLSLMHDVFYSKAELIHTWYGYCIRVFSLLATVAALLLFRRLIEEDGYRRADVAATYVLLAGAVVLEITSALRAMFSTWTYGKLIRKRRYCVARALAWLALIPLWFRSHAVAMYEICRERVGIGASSRYWSGTMGQHNFIYMCSHCKDSRGSKMARWVGREDWWNMLVYTSSVPVSPHISEILKKQVKESHNVNKENPDHIRNSRGRAALKRRPELYEELNWSVDTELRESILVWHIATHIYLNWYETKHARCPHHLAQVTGKLSNYMMFLLAERPYMLPDNVGRHGYLALCYILIHELQCLGEDLLSLLRDHGDAVISGQTEDAAREIGSNTTFDNACRLGVKLISKDLESPDANIVELISQVCVELLCYAAYRCLPDSHARQLSNGGELTTVVALLLVYMEYDILTFESVQDRSEDSMASSDTEPGTGYV